MEIFQHGLYGLARYRFHFLLILGAPEVRLHALTQMVEALEQPCRIAFAVNKIGDEHFDFVRQIDTYQTQCDRRNSPEPIKKVNEQIEGLRDHSPIGNLVTIYKGYRIGYFKLGRNPLVTTSLTSQLMLGASPS